MRAIWKLQQRRQATPLALRDPAELEGIVVAPDELLEEINASLLELALGEIRPEFNAEVWNAFVALWSDGKQPQAVAEQLGRSTGWVYNAKFRVLQRLKDVVGRMAHELDEF